jgi:hypothetical protein
MDSAGNGRRINEIGIELEGLLFLLFVGEKCCSVRHGSQVRLLICFACSFNNAETRLLAVVVSIKQPEEVGENSVCVGVD